MEATRTRLSFTGEWLTAAAFLAATLVVGLLVVRELRVPPPQALDTAAEPVVAAASVPPDAVSVPALALGGAREIRVGDSAVDALARLDPAFALVGTTAERGPLGRREVRSYQLAGTRFLLVLEPFVRGGELRVAAIYLQ